MFAFSNPYFNQLEKNDNVVSHYTVYHEDRRNKSSFVTFVEQTYLYKIENLHTLKYKEMPDCLTDDYSDYVSTIKYKTQFVDLLVEITEWQADPENFHRGSAIIIKVMVDKLFSRTKSTDYEDLTKLIPQIETLVCEVNKDSNEEYHEEQQELCAIEYAMDHC